LSKFLIALSALLHVKHYKLIDGRDNERMTTKERAAAQKLVASKKTAEELAYEEYQRELELAIENH